MFRFPSTILSQPLRQFPEKAPLRHIILKRARLLEESCERESSREETRLKGFHNKEMYNRYELKVNYMIKMMEHEGEGTEIVFRNMVQILC